MKKICLLFAVLLASTLMNAQNETIRPPRLKVGVVLGGGGAKGASHIGVLKYLEEMGIPIDYVAGTSMGSIIGGLYALGYTPDELTQLIAAMNWSEYIGNKMDRPIMSNELRQRNSTLMLNVPFSLDYFFENNPNASFISQLPSAYVNNSSLINLFNDLCVGYQEDMDFNDLPIPFACVATDIITGDEVVLRSGSVPTAMRASMAIPGLFSPVTIGDKVLVDGGLVNNFPADVLQEMGADIIIGVEVASTKDVTVDNIRSLPQVFGQLVTNSTSAKRVSNRELCAIYIAPDVRGFGMLSFTPEAIDTLVGRGYKRASEFHDQLLSVKRAVDASAGHPVSKTLRAPHAKNIGKEAVFIRSITFNVNDKDTQWLLRKGGLKVGKYYNQDDIDHALKVYRGTGCFDEITYQVMECDSIHWDNQLSDAYALNINMKPAKPHIVGVGVRYDTEEGAALLLNLGLNEKKFNGSKLNFSAKLSYNPRLNLTYTYSKSSLANFNLGYQYRSEHFRTSDANVTNLVNLHYFQRGISGYISQFHLLNYCTTVGASYTSTTFDNSSMEGNAFDTIWFVSNKNFVPFANIKYDNLDDAYFATKGLCTSLSSHYFWNPRNSGNNNFDICYALQYYYTPNGSKFTFIPQIFGRYLLHNPSHYNLFSNCGGEIAGRHFENQLPFVGITHLEATTRNVTVARCDLRYNFLGKHYLTAMYNTLIGWNQPNYLYHGAGLKYSYRSLLGPVSLTAQWTNLYYHHFSAYFSFGYTF